MKKLLILALAATMLLSGCASILNGKYQKITINHDRGDEVLIDGERPTKKNGYYLVERDQKPKQITVKSDGYKDENLVVMQYKRSPLTILSYIPFGILFFPMFMDIGPKAFNYEKEVSGFELTETIMDRSEEAKEIKVNKVSIDLEKSNMKYRFFPSYSDFLRTESYKETEEVEDEEDVKIEYTEFAEALNEILKEKGYLDTSNKVLKDSYIDNLMINATVKDYTVHNVRHGYTFSGMIYIDLAIDWEALDYYGTVIHTERNKSTSGEYAVTDYDKVDKVIEKAVKDAMEYSLIDFMSSPVVDSLLHDRSEVEKEMEFEDILIPRPVAYVDDLPQSIKSSLTIKTKDKHGSGFVVSSNGYILTNYHVVADTTGLTVVLNDESEHDAEVIRASKVYDLALLKIDATDLVPFEINDSRDIGIASEVYAVGTPSGGDLSQTISKGIISGIRKMQDSKLIQTDASINSGNSGGPLVTKDGRLVGVVSSKLKGFGVEGVAFGIPSYEIVDRLKIRYE